MGDGSSSGSPVLLINQQIIERWYFFVMLSTLLLQWGLVYRYAIIIVRFKILSFFLVFYLD